MAGGLHLTALALLLLTLTPAASAAAWKRITSAADTRRWQVSVLPSGVGYAAARGPPSYKYIAYNGTQDGGKTWKTLVTAPSGAAPVAFQTVGTGSLLTFEGNVGDKTMFWKGGSPATWATQTVGVPKGKTPAYVEMAYIKPLPGLTQAFGAGSFEAKDGSYLQGTWYWDGGNTWKFTQASDISRWNGTAWVRFRKGEADESLQLLTTVPATATTPAMVWARLTKSTNGKDTQSLLLCDTAKCTAKRAAGTTGTYPGSFQQLQGFDAASPNFALVWEVQSSNNPNVTTACLLQFNGTKWTTVLKTPVRLIPNGPPQAWGQPTITSPQLRVSVASPTRAVALLFHMPPANSNTTTLVTHTWNGATWTQQSNATFSRAELGDYPSGRLQALNSGSALMTLATGMWRLA